MGTLAEMILERDKVRQKARRIRPQNFLDGFAEALWRKRGGGIVVTMSTTNDAGAAQDRPAPEGKPGSMPSAALLLLHVVMTTLSSSRLAFDIDPDFQCAH